MRAAILRAHQRERGALTLANRWAAANEIEHPYWLANLRTYQNIYADALRERLRLLRLYLASRGARNSPSD